MSIRIALLCLCVGTTVAATAWGQNDLQQNVDALIQQLGAESYRDRESAEARLEALGLLAFEPLQEVLNHPDIEIRLRARAMVSKLRRLFLSEGIDPVLLRYVRDYESLPKDRRNLVTRVIATFLPQQGLEVLARIARFEESELLAKQAALAILEAAIEVPEDERSAWLESVHEAAAISRRKPTVWLRCFSSLPNADPEQLVEEWDSFIAAEVGSRDTGGSETNDEVILRLRRLHADLLEFGDVTSNARSNLIAEPIGSEDDARDWLLWLQEREDWTRIIELHDRNETLFAADRVLLYGVAEAHRESGDVSQATSFADRAFQLGVPTDQAGNEEERRQMGIYLEDERGQFDWAEREYRAAFDEHSPNNDLEGILRGSTYDRYRALFPLSEMLHDQQRELEAAQVLKQIEEDAEADEALLQYFPQLGRVFDSTLSRMHFFYAEYYRSEGDVEKQRKHLEQGYEADPSDADLLIAMYRFEGGDEEWKTKVERAISEASAAFRSRIRDARVEQSQNASGLLSAELAQALNQFAWLVGNTTGDGHEALRYSQQSLELTPGNSGFLDTLARCYYNVGEIDEAIRHQIWALRRSPHEGQLHRQLEFFRRAEKND